MYNLSIPGIADSGVSDNELVSSVTLTGTNAAPPGEISTLWTRIDTGQVHPVVYTFDSAGNPIDRDFSLLVYRADHEVQ